MIAIGRDGENVVFLGSNAKGIVRMSCDLDEALAVLRQLQALLGPVAVPQPAGPALRPPPRLVSVGGDEADLDPAGAAAARDAAELAARGETPSHKSARRAPAQEEMEKREQRRAQKLAAAGHGTVEGPVDE